MNAFGAILIAVLVVSVVSWAYIAMSSIKVRQLNRRFLQEQAAQKPEATMRVITIKDGEKIRIGSDIEVVILDGLPRPIRLGIAAPGEALIEKLIDNGPLKE